MHFALSARFSRVAIWDLVDRSKTPPAVLLAVKVMHMHSIFDTSVFEQAPVLLFVNKLFLAFLLQPTAEGQT